MSVEGIFVGIDYGAKLAGTTALCYLKEGQLQLEQSEKKKDADAFLIEHLNAIKPKCVFIDAPLSLPMVYSKAQEEADFFYRKADRLTKAMSPMFLGGLTARAMRLKHQLSKQEITFYETYPAYLVREVLEKPVTYNKKKKETLIAFWTLLKSYLPFENIEANPQNWHQVDAVLAWWSGWRYLNKQSFILGEEKEGQIIV